MPPTVLSRPSPHLQILIVHGKGNAVGGERRAVDGDPVELIGDTGRVTGQAEDQADLSFKTHSRPQKIVMLPAPGHMADQRHLPFQPWSSPYCPVGDTEIGRGSHERDRLLLANECESYHSVTGPLPNPTVSAKNVPEPGSAVQPPLLCWVLHSPSEDLSSRTLRRRKR